MRGQRHGMEVLRASVVPMTAVPQDVPLKRRTPMYQPLYEQIRALPGGEVLRVEFPTRSLALSVRASLRKIATRDGAMLSSNREMGGLVRFFWLEPKE